MKKCHMADFVIIRNREGYIKASDSLIELKAKEKPL